MENSCTKMKLKGIKLTKIVDFDMQMVYNNLKCKNAGEKHGS